MAEEKISIIPATAEDQLVRIAELAHRIWRAHYPGIITTEQIDYMLARMYSLGTLCAEIRSQDISFFQLLLGDQLAGFASIGPTNQPADRKLHKLYLVPESHGRGLGKRLLRHCEAEAAGEGARRLILAVNKCNVKALAFYQRNGFSVIESVVNDIGGGFVMDDFIMAKNVGQ